MSDKGTASRIYKEPENLNRKKINDPVKNMLKT